MKENKGITLIALVITIIILFILAGVTISLVLGNNGILNRATDAVVVSKIKEAEEFARMSYMERQIDEIVDEEEATIAGVISDLKEQGYTIKQDIGSENSITGIALSEEKVAVERNTEKTVTYTLVYSGKIRYFVQVQGEYYEISFSNGNITISTEPTELNITVKEPKVIVESNDSSIIEVSKIEDGKLLLTAKDKLGEVEITVKEINTGVTKKFTATTQIVVTSISIAPTEKTIGVGETANLTLSVEPSNATNKEVIWISSNTEVATVLDTGVVEALSLGTTIITAKAIDGSTITSNECTITVVESVLLDRVNEKQSAYYGKKVIGYTANGISDWRIFYADNENVFLITTEYLSSSVLPMQECGLLVGESSNCVYWRDLVDVANTTNVEKFSPVTSETMKWNYSYGTNVNGRCVSQLLDTSKWTSFVDSSKADMAIGSPTLNMWVASWNAKYPSQKISCNYANQKGYYLGISYMTNMVEIEHDMMRQLSGWLEKDASNMYYPHKSRHYSCDGYWLASPSASGVEKVMTVWWDGGILPVECLSGKTGSVRPVVCLKSDVKMTKNVDGIVTLK